MLIDHEVEGDAIVFTDGLVDVEFLEGFLVLLEIGDLDDHL